MNDMLFIPTMGRGSKKEARLSRGYFPPPQKDRPTGTGPLSVPVRREQEQDETKVSTPPAIQPDVKPIPPYRPDQIARAKAVALGWPEIPKVIPEKPKKKSMVKNVVKGAVAAGGVILTVAGVAFGPKIVGSLKQGETPAGGAPAGDITPQNPTARPPERATRQPTVAPVEPTETEAPTVAPTPTAKELESPIVSEYSNDLTNDQQAALNQAYEILTTGKSVEQKANIDKGFQFMGLWFEGQDEQPGISSGQAQAMTSFVEALKNQDVEFLEQYGRFMNTETKALLPFGAIDKRVVNKALDVDPDLDSVHVVKTDTYGDINIIFVNQKEIAFEAGIDWTGQNPNLFSGTRIGRDFLYLLLERTGANQAVVNFKDVSLKNSSFLPNGLSKDQYMSHYGALPFGLPDQARDGGYPAFIVIHPVENGLLVVDVMDDATNPSLEYDYHQALYLAGIPDLLYPTREHVRAETFSADFGFNPTELSIIFLDVIGSEEVKEIMSRPAGTKRFTDEFILFP